MVNNLQIFKDNFKYMMKNWWDWEKKLFVCSCTSSCNCFASNCDCICTKGDNRLYNK